jgi:dienelactone hydrolase
MAEELAAHGYIVVSVQHHRSDTDYLNEHGLAALLAAASEEETRQLRPEDISFVLDEIEAGTTGAALLAPSRIDLTKIGIMGHSFGAWTTLSCLGQTFDGNTDMADDRFDCGVAYSPQGPGTLGLDAGSWNNLHKPTLTMHGTNDTSVGTPDAAERRIAYDSMPANGTKYHATLQDAEHDDFGNNGGFYHGWIKQMTLAFFDAYLRDNAAALAWLQAGTIEDITAYVVLEHK